MPSRLTWQIAILALLPALLSIVFVISKGAKRRLPPGPMGIPLIGSVHNLPSTLQEKTFTRWGQKYGDIIYLKLFRTPTVILNSIEAARELLEKRSAKYSDRPRMVLLAEMLGQRASLPTIPYGERLRKHRRWMHEGVGTKEKLREYQHIQRREVRNLVRHLVDDPASFRDHLHLYLAAILLEVTYGKQITSLDNDLVQVADRALEGTDAAGSPGSTLVDFFPILKWIPSWFPGMGFKRHAMKTRPLVEAWKNMGFDIVVSAMASGTVLPCIFSTVLAEYDGTPTPEEADDMKGLGISVYGAGVETSRGALTLFFLIMTWHPHILRKAQEEMDRVVGSERYPDFSDRPLLPYLNALLEEVYRWNPSLPLGLPHRLVTRDEYREYDIPAGCMIIPNVWAMTRDTRFFPDPEEFRPERFLNADAQCSGHLLPSSFVFGFGRRICPGQAFADATIWLAMANIVAFFDIKKAIDEDGNEINPSPGFLSGFSSQPAPFVCQIALRSERNPALGSSMPG